jgi:hypothetical protein
MTSSANQLKPMFLLGVEDNPKPSPYLDAINSAKAAGAEHWQIWSLLAFNPEAADHLCMKAHAAVAGHLYEDEEFIWSVLRDPESSKLRATGWDDAAIYYAITATALFNFYNRWISASGVHPVSDETFRLYSRRMADHGYIRESPKT